MLIWGDIVHGSVRRGGRTPHEPARRGLRPATPPQHATQAAGVTPMQLFRALAIR
jgi:hypothetical protein